jgi:C-terminal processing protease CtpA/Prc
LVVSVVALSGLFFVEKTSVEPLVNNDLIVPTESNKQIDAVQEEEVIVGKNETAEAETEAGNSSLPANKSSEIAKKADERNRNLKATLPNRKTETDEGGGSRDSGSTSIQPRTQPEFDANRKIDPTGIPQSKTVTKLSEVWNLIGITVDGLKVTSVGKSSLAERSGLKIGDVIQAIDGKIITADSISDEQINVRSVTVVRKGAKQEIPLRNN